MDIGKYLSEEIRKCRHRMNLAMVIDRGILCAAAGGIAGIFCEAISLFLPFYRVHRAAALCFFAGFLAGVCHAVYRRADMKKAAGRLDSFGLKERMLTAYENLDKEDGFALLQRQDAYRHYERVRGEVRISVVPDRRHVLALFVAAAAAVGIGVIPSPVREQAEATHQVKEEAKEEREELEELLDALEGVDMESLTEAQKAELQELLDTMELSREELAGVDTWESLSAATGRLDYKYQQAAQSLSGLAGQLEYPDMAGVAGAEALAKALANAAQNDQQMASAGTASGNPGGEDGQNGEGASGEENDGSGENGSGGENGQGGESGAGNGDGQNGGSNSGEGSGQNGGNSASGGGQSGGNGSGGGQSGENGSGGESGGNGEGGSGGGNGQGTGSSSGGGAGGGRGTGSSDTAHDYVSIPGAVADDSSLTGNKTGDQDSDYYRQQNGLAWEGDHVEYSSVIGEYTDSAYEGIANGKYPSGMETVIRDYFENLNK